MAWMLLSHNLNVCGNRWHVQTFFKKYFFLVNLLFIAAAAYLTARAGNKFTAYFLTPVVQEPSALAVNSGTAPSSKPKRDFGEATERNVFGAERENLEPTAEVEEEEEKPANLDGEPVVTELGVKLINTTVFDPPEWSLATIEDASSKETGLYSINACPPGQKHVNMPDDSGGAEPDQDEDEATPPVLVRSIQRPEPCNRLLDVGRITAIEVTRVVFFNEDTNRMEFLDFNAEPKAGPRRPRVASSKKDERPQGPSGEGIKKVGANNYEIAQSEIDATLSNLNSIATQARIVPSFKDGQADGFKLFSIRPGSLYSKIGIKNGDVIQRINGYEITSPDKALEIYSKLKDAKGITVDLARRGKPQTLEYAIVP